MPSGLQPQNLPKPWPRRWLRRRGRLVEWSWQAKLRLSCPLAIDDLRPLRSNQLDAAQPEALPRVLISSAATKGPAS